MKRFLLLLLLSVPLFAVAQVDPCLPAKPSDEDHLVFQYTDFLSDHEVKRLDDKLTLFAQQTSNRIAVVVVDTLCGLEPSDFAFQLGESWGIGQKGKDNGILVLVKPTGTPGQRKIFIATGYGLEGPIPDLMNKRIIEERIIPRFKQHEFFAGLDEGTDALMTLARSEFNEQSLGSKRRGPGIWPLVVMAVFFILILLAQRNKVKRYSHTNNVDFWSAWWLLNQASRSHRGSWGGFSGGGGSSGGGGFGGFGGGSFGGGGAGGSW